MPVAQGLALDAAFWFIQPHTMKEYAARLVTQQPQLRVIAVMAVFIRENKSKVGR